MQGFAKPTHYWVPEYDKTFGGDVAELNTLAGFEPDPEQRLALDAIFAKKYGGKSAAFEVGVVCGRQNIKTALEIMAINGWLFYFNERLVVYSAHEFGDLDLRTPILTINRGWQTMGSVCAGDEVFAPDGQPTKITGAHPVLRDSDCYRLYLADGQEFVAGGRHLWQATEAGQRGGLVDRVVSTREIARCGVDFVSRRAGRDRRTFRWRLPLPEPLHMPDRELPVTPWLLGAWLGDGQTGEGKIACGAEDLSYLCSRLDDLGYQYRPYPDSRWPDRVSTVSIFGLRQQLRAAGVLDGKYIPADYLLAAPEQRLELLRGLMDTDGTVSDGRQLAISMVSEPLMVQVLELVRSLGYKATLRRFSGGTQGPRAIAAPPEFIWRVQFAPNEVTPFGMPRKTAKIAPLKVTRSAYNAIVSIEPVLTRPTRCITVAHESGCYLAGKGFTVTHNTAMEVFRLMVDLVTNSDFLRRDIRKIVRNHGEEAIELKTGGRVIFRTRTKGGGRGLSGNKVVFDEGMFLKAQHLGALLPTMSAQPDPQVLYGSSAGMAESEVLRDLRDRGRAGGEPSAAWLEWCAPDPAFACDAGDRCTHVKTAIGCGCDKPDFWAMANPALGKHRSNGTGLSYEYIKAERRALPVSEFCRERMGWWDLAEEGAAPLSPQLWRQLGKSSPGMSHEIAVGVDVSPDSAVSAIGIATWGEDGKPHIELAEHLPGTGWVLDRVMGIVERRKPLAVVINPSGPAGAFEQHLRNRDFITLADDKSLPFGRHRLVLTTGRAYAQACGDLTNMVTNGRLGHPSQPPLDNAVEGARSRPIAQAWGWAAAPGFDITPLVAVTLALHGLITFGGKPPPEPFFLQ